MKPENLQIAPVSTHGLTKEGTATVFEVEGETLAEYWECTEKMPTFPGTNESDQLMNDGGDATFLTHKGTKLEADWAKVPRTEDMVTKGELRLKPDPTSITLELDLVFDALSELSGEDGCDWVRVRRVQALTSLRLRRLEELFEDWDSMGVIRRDDTRRWVALCPSVEAALN